MTNSRTAQCLQAVRDFFNDKCVCWGAGALGGINVLQNGQSSIFCLFTRLALCSETRVHFGQVIPTRNGP